MAYYPDKTKQAGFTLVEVIVVIVIIAILAAIGVPALTGYIDKANQRKLLAMAREVTTAAQTLISENYLNKEYDGNYLSFYFSESFTLISGQDSDGDGIYEGSFTDDDYSYDDTEDPSTYVGEGAGGFNVEMWKLTKIPLRIYGDENSIFPYIAFTEQGQILAWLMYDPYLNTTNGDGRMIGYNVSSDTNYSPYYGKDGSIPPSYDPNAGFSYWKVKNDGKSIELGW